MKFILLSILAFSLNTFATTKDCQEFSGTFNCKSTNPGIEPETKTFSVQNKVLSMNINPFEEGPQVYNLDGKTYSKISAQGDVIETTANCKGNVSTVVEQIKVMGYERDYSVTFIDSNHLRFTDTTLYNPSNSSAFGWNCTK